MPNWLRIVLVIALALVFWWLVANLGRSVAENPAPPPSPAAAPSPAAP